MNVVAVQGFVLIANGLQFNEAAELLHIEPSHLTKLIQGLERALGGAKLMHRSRWQIELTEAGRAAVRPARELLAAAHRIGKSVNPHQLG